MRRRIVAALIVAVGLTTAGVAYAENQPPDPSVPGTPSSASTRARGAKDGMRGSVPKGAVHGDLLVLGEDGQTRTVTFDRGKVTAIDGSSITIERPDGVSVSKALTGQTAFNGKNRDELAPGMGVVVVSDGDTATRIVARGARKEAAAKRCADRPAAVAPNGSRTRIKERACQRLERRSSVADDGLETILS